VAQQEAIDALHNYWKLSQRYEAEVALLSDPRARSEEGQSKLDELVKKLDSARHDYHSKMQAWIGSIEARVKVRISANAK
jgi:hypothetical protein